LTRMIIDQDGLIQINTTPLTAGGTYDLLVRNSTNGYVEKIASNTYAVDANVMHLSGTEIFSGSKMAVNAGTTGTTNGFVLSNNGTGDSASLKISNNSTGIGSFYTNGNGIANKYESSTGTTGDLIQFTKNLTLTSKIDHNGRYIVSGSPASNILLAGGTDIPQSAVARPYLVYTAKISQSSTGAPTVLVLENTLGGTPTYAYSSIGTYTATLTGAFSNSSKVVSTITYGVGIGTTSGRIGTHRVDNDTIRIWSLSNGSAADGQIQDCFFEIRVYL
jgi:hypothetical protein